jgi:hypothetical protein
MDLHTRTINYFARAHKKIQQILRSRPRILLNQVMDYVLTRLYILIWKDFHMLYTGRQKLHFKLQKIARI